MKFTPWNVFFLFALLGIAILEIGVLLRILPPALQEGNPMWPFVDIGALFGTVVLSEWQMRRVFGFPKPVKKMPDWQRMKQFSSWYGSLGYIWAVLQFILNDLLIRQVIGPNGMAWKVGLGIEIAATFGLLMILIKKKLEPNPPPSMGRVLWPSYMIMLLIFATIFLPAWPPSGTGLFPMVDGHLDPQGIKMLCFFLIFMGGLVYYGIKEKRAGVAST